MKVSVIIPAKNEEHSIGRIIEESKKFCDEVIVIDGHSTDMTREVSARHGAVVYSDHGRGKGDGIRCAIEKASGDILVFIDADDSHDPDDIPKIIKPILEGNADHVSTSRNRGGSDELHGDLEKFMRMVGSDIITLGINYRFDVRLTDSQCGFRAALKKTLQELDLREDITTIEQEMIIKSLKKGFRIIEVPVHEYKRSHGRSKIILKKVIFRYVYSWLKYMFF